MFICDSGLAKQNYFTLSNSGARRFSLSTPAAFEGYAGDVPINPAGFNLYSNEYEPKFEIFFNPAGALMAVYGLSNGEYSNGTFDEGDVLIPMFLLVKGINLSVHPFDFGLVLGEQNQIGFEGNNFFSYFPVLDDYYNRMFLQLELHRKVAVGLSAEFFFSDEKIKGVGVSYGVMIKPGKLHVGVFYYMLPHNYQDSFLYRDRIVEDTVNAGLSWEPVGFLKMYFDLRNLSEENSPTFLEPHAGMETFIWEHTAVRFGFYHEDGERNVFSFGVGLLDLNDFKSLDDQSQRKEYLLNYGLEILPHDEMAHSLSLNFRL